MKADINQLVSVRSDRIRIAVIAPSRITSEGFLSRRANTMQVMKMTQAFTNLGYDVHMIVPEKCPYHLISSDNQDVENTIWDTLSQHYGLRNRFPIEWTSANPRFRSYDYSLRAVYWAFLWKADIIYTRLPQAGAIASTIGLPTILETHDLPQGNFGPWIINRFLKGKGAYRWVVITQALASDLLQRYSPPSSSSFMVIAPDGVDLERYLTIPNPVEARVDLLKQIPSAEYLTQECKFQLQYRLNHDGFIVGYTGHLYKGRGTEILLELAKRLPETTFLIVGGEQQDVSHFQSEVNSRNLENIILTGFIPNRVLPLYQAVCDVLIMPYQQRVAASSGGDISRYLSPMKLFEYMACQRVIVSSNLPVLHEILNSQNSILLSSEDVDEWVSALRELQTNPKKLHKLAAKAHEDAHLYSWERRVERILEGYNYHSTGKGNNQ